MEPGYFKKFADELFITGLATIAGWIFVALLRKLRQQLRQSRIEGPEEIAAPVAAAPTLSLDLLPEGASVAEKVTYLEEQRDTAQEAARTARRRGEDDGPAEERYALLDRTLDEMAFLAKGDVLEERFHLHQRIGGGRTAVVWKAYDALRDRPVAIKLLRHPHVVNDSFVHQFFQTSRIMAELKSPNIATVWEEGRQATSGDSRKLAYYVLEHIEGETLDVYARRYPDRKQAILENLFEVGRSIAAAHEQGVLLRDLKPSNILVEASGTLKLVDFDAVLRTGERYVSHLPVGTSGYSAPEVLEGAAGLDDRADVFALGRVFAFIYFGSELPGAYEMSSAELADVLNSAPGVKQAITRATAPHPRQRYGSIQAFLTDLREAVRQDGERLPVVDTLRQERQKIYRILQHSFFGTLVVMTLARPILAFFQAVQLSDTVFVAVFHSVIGSLMWGVLISAAYVLYLISVRRSGAQGYLLAMAFCAVGGLLGGVICAVPSIFVTHVGPLQCLGWLTPGDYKVAIDRFPVALFETRMLLTYPLTGLLTGCGLGLALNRAFVQLLRTRPQGTGLLPVPIKFGKGVRSSVLESLRLVAGSYKSHLCLAFPILFSWLVVLAVHAHFPPPANVDCAEGVLPREAWRAVGEGVVHYLGAIGLAVGFFFRVGGNWDVQGR